VSIWFLWASAATLALGCIAAAFTVSGKFGSVIKGIRDDEQRVRFLGYSVESYKLFIFTLTAMIAAIAGVLYYPQAGIINPAEIAPIASIYLAVWVAIGGRGRLYGAVIGAAFVSLVSSWFTGGLVGHRFCAGYPLCAARHCRGFRPHHPPDATPPPRGPAWSG
jgi:urea transport system permease protein